MNNVWVTGAHTPLGHGVAAFFKAAGFSVAESGANFDDINYEALTSFAYFKGSFAAIIHCSMEFDPAVAERNPLLVICKDKAMPLQFLRLARTQGARFIAIGSPYVFSGALASRDYTEKYRAAPVCALGRLQLEGERAILDADPDAVLLRTGWLYGGVRPHSFPSDALIDAILQAGAKGASGTVQVPADAVVSPTYLKSLARVVLDITLPSCAPDLRPLPGGVYHYADWGHASFPEFAAEAARLALEHKLIDRPVGIVPLPASVIPAGAARPFHQRLSAQKLMHSMMVFQHPWQDCLDEYLCGRVRENACYPPVNQAARTYKW
jgi:dTDP-4-dehydrorhamnose reductase